MIEGLDLAVEVVNDLLSAGFIVFLRVGAMMAVLPAFGEQAVPMRIRLVLAVAFTLIVAPAVSQSTQVPVESVTGMTHFVITESIIGLILGMMLRLFVIALQTAGSIAAQATSLAQIFGGTAAEPMPAMGHLLVVGGLALAVMAGFHIRVSEWIILSYDLFEPGRFPRASLVSEWGTMRIARAFSLAFTLAMPFVIASLIYNLALGVINKAMPQLMVAFVGAPVITAGGLVLLFLVAPLMLQVWMAAMNEFFFNPIGTSR